jgi:hypothetical protein
MREWRRLMTKERSERTETHYVKTSALTELISKAKRTDSSTTILRKLRLVYSVSRLAVVWRKKELRTVSREPYYQMAVVVG